ncbi:MAG: DEAD/DEAH box helicase [Proteobacteria bacterium]|nr:DEAD/DEAH box helicase [Pseudomonadota bacterium]
MTQRHPKKYYPRKKRERIPHQDIIIKPGADKVLKEVFSHIGIPEKTPFVPDPYQQEAVEAIGHSDCLVMAPTGSGKTWIAEQAIDKALKNNQKVWYGTPLKALTNTIYARFIDVFGKNTVGILTGDIKENPDAPVIIGTTEILRNQLYDSMHSGKDLGCDLVILDEAHFLGDVERGVVWEEIMIYLPSRIPLLMLSATIGNPHQIADWLSKVRGNPCRVIEETQRAVPLYPLFFHPDGTLYPLVSRMGKGGLNKYVAEYASQRNAPQIARPGKLPPMDAIMNVLRHYDLLPAIFFMKSRADCNTAIELCSSEGIDADPVRKETLQRRVEELLSTNEHIKTHKQRWHLENLAVGAHHSGQLPTWKIVIETLMSEGLLDAMFATSTVAAGVNFPARTVVILNSDRFNGADFISLTPTEFSQMTGRSGRRGMDKIGFAVALPGKFMNLRLMAKLVGMPPESVLSQIKINFSMILNLLLSHSPEQIRGLLQNSFATYLMAQKTNPSPQKKVFGLKGHNDYLWGDFLLHLDFLKQEGFVDKDNRLTDDGIWASRLRIDTPLLVAEGFRLNLFPKNDPALLAAIISAFVNEREFTESASDRKNAPKKLLTSFLKVKRMLTPFAHAMLDCGFDVSPLFLQPAVTIYTWASGGDWQDVCANSGLAEGDLSRLILRTGDNLHHIANLTEHFPQEAKTALEAKDIIMREPVVTGYSS